MIRKYPSQPGGGLHEVIVRHFLKQLASALEFLRARNFIHRDVKPQNLLLNPSPLYLAKDQNEPLFSASEDSLVPVAGIASLPMLKIADFGFARSLPSTSLAETLCGSPLYMAPEILRYEKYDAKADLWSVGTVLYEMVVGRPPFRASNHVELLRRIERGEDRIGFPEGLVLSEDLKRLIRGLLKRGPVERMAFKDFFNHPVIKDEIPGLVGEDIPKEASSLPPDSPTAAQQDDGITREMQAPAIETKGVKDAGESREARPLNPAAQFAATPPRSTSMEKQRSTTPQRTAVSSRPPVEPRRLTEGPPETTYLAHREQASTPRRPSMVTHATAPARPDLYQGRGPVAAAAMMDRQSSRNSSSPGSSLMYQHRQEVEPKAQQRHEERVSRDVREKAEQEVAFERDYVLVEKRAVEVNAFADELAASPRIHGQSAARPTGAMTRRATTQGTSPTSGGAQTTPSRAVQIATNKPRPNHLHQRKSSYERRHGASPGSTTSAISKALNMANFRLFGVGFSPPFVGKGGYSPPQAYGAFPAYPITQGSLIMVGEGPKSSVPPDEDFQAVQVIEEAATRSDVVYWFAEVKYKQLIPLAPSTGQGLGLRAAGITEQKEKETREEGKEAEDSLTIDAIVTLSEEALVLFVKVLALLAKTMDVAGAWWARKNRGEVVSGSPSARTEANAALITAGNRINNVVQWVRARFNEVLEKAEFVTLKLVEAQKQLPVSHPSHPSNHPVSSASTRMGTSADTVVVGSGVTAEKLMYERALEMSRTAAVNELVGEELAGCEIAYVTAVRMLEAVLEADEGGSEMEDEMQPINGMQVEDRQVVEKRG